MSAEICVVTETKHPLIDYGSNLLGYGALGYASMAAVIQMYSMGGLNIQVAAYLSLTIGLLMAFKIIVDVFMLDERMSRKGYRSYHPVKYYSPHGPLPA